jgi:DNA invertase Pin-like site-specific DNA recombinase
MSDVCVYVRKSAAGHVPHAEVTALTDVAVANDWFIAFSVVDSADRRELREVLQMRGNGFDRLLVWSLDRLTPSPREFERLYRVFARDGVRITAVDPRFGFTPPAQPLSDEPAVQRLRAAFEAPRWWVYAQGLAPRYPRRDRR